MKNYFQNYTILRIIVLFMGIIIIITLIRHSSFMDFSSRKILHFNTTYRHFSEIIQPKFVFTCCTCNPCLVHFSIVLDHRTYFDFGFYNTVRNPVSIIDSFKCTDVCKKAISAIVSGQFILCFKKKVPNTFECMFIFDNNMEDIPYCGRCLNPA